MATAGLGQAARHSNKVWQREDPRRWCWSMRSWAGSHVAKERFGIQAKRKLAVSGGDLLAQIRSQAVISQLARGLSFFLPPLPLPLPLPLFLPHIVFCCIASPCLSSDVAFVQGSVKAVESISHAGWMSHASPIWKKGVWCRGLLMLAAKSLSK